MSYKSLALWFSWKGRVNRQPFIFAELALLGLVIVTEWIPDNNTGLNLLLLPVFLLILYSYFVLGIKRAHDLGRSGFFMLLLFIPLVAIWPFVEFTFLRGTSGPNRYGEDPLW